MTWEGVTCGGLGLHGEASTVNSSALTSMPELASLFKLLLLMLFRGVCVEYALLADILGCQSAISTDADVSI